MVVEHVDAGSLAPPVGYRHASRSVGRVAVRIAGQVGVDADGHRVGGDGDYTSQAEQALNNAIAAFAAAGASPDDIAELTYYVVELDEERAAQVNRGLGRSVRRHGMPAVPATMVGITALMHRDLLIEVNGSAVVD
jgi:enamine deaminase RidA (YjgF/YER057c/UK114 family)